MDTLRPPIILLGAGASVDAGLPTTADMTKAMVEAIQGNNRARYVGTLQALNYVVGASIEHATAAGHNPFGAVNIEQLFSAVELLAERTRIEVAPFVEAWRPAVEQCDRPRWPNDLKGAISDALLRGRDIQLNRAFRQAIQAETRGVSGEVYRQLMQEMLDALRRLVNIDTAGRVSYLHPITDLSKRFGSCTIATLNYDRSVEMICEEQSCHVSLGLADWMETGRVTFPSSGVLLLKLHGSIDWWMRQPVGQLGRMPQSEFGVGAPPAHGCSPAVIFGQRGKLRAQGPYLDLFMSFRRALDAASTLVTVGYSFRDEHVNEVIVRWSNGDPMRHIIIVDPEFPERGSRTGIDDDFRLLLTNSLMPQDPPLSAGRSFDPRVTILRERAERGLGNAIEPWLT